MTATAQSQAATSDAAGASRKGAWKHYLLAAAVAAMIVAWRLPAETMDDHECKMALSARAMADPHPDPWLLEAADGGVAYEIPPCTEFNQWMAPVENGRPRLVKTPLPYWCAAMIGKAYAGLGYPAPCINNLTARLTSVISAVLLVLVTLGLGRRMFSPRAALMGALMLATCIGFQKWGRDARPEMLLCLLMTAAMALFYLATESPSRWGRVGWMAAFWVMMGLANLAKEFVPLLLGWSLAAWLFYRQSLQDGDDEQSLAMLKVFLIATAAGLLMHLTRSYLPMILGLGLGLYAFWRLLVLREPRQLAASAIGIFVLAMAACMAGGLLVCQRPWKEALGGGRAYYATMAVAFGVPMLWYFLRSRGWRPVIGILPTAVPGAAVMLAMFVPWMLYMTRLFPSMAAGVFSEQVTERAAGEGAWTVAGADTYFRSLLTMTLPWVALVPGAAAAALMKRFASHRRGLVYLLLWSIGLVGLFTAAAAKREHYILPMIPAFCLLLGFIAEDVFFNHVWITPRLARRIGGAYGLAAVGGVVGLALAAAFAKDRAPYVHMSIVVAIAAVPVCMAALKAWRGQFRPVVGLLVAGMVVVYCGYFTRIDLWDKRRAIYEFATLAAATVPADAPIYEYGDPQAKMAFYFGRYVPAAQWPFNRMEAQLAAQGDKDAAVKAEAAFKRWMEDDRNAPWIIGYEKEYNTQTRKIERTLEAVELERLGYKPVSGVSLQSREDNKYLFTLYHRQGDGRAASQPASQRAGE